MNNGMDASANAKLAKTSVSKVLEVGLWVFYIFGLKQNF